MKSKIILYIIIVLFLVVSTVSAHLGRTDSNGGHTCRTNCEKWGLKDGEYHYHNRPIPASTPTPTPTPESTITSTPTSDYSTVKPTDTQNQVINRLNQTDKNFSQGEERKNWFEGLITWLFG